MHVPAYAAALAYQGRRREALEAIDEFPEGFQGKRGARAGLKLDLMLGDPPTPALLAEARAVAREADPEMTKSIAVALAWLGDLDGAAELAPKLAPELRPHYEAAAAWRRGDLDRALSIVRDLSSTRKTGERAPALWMLAHCAFDAGKDDEVVNAADGLRVSAGGGWRTWALPDAQLLAARALDRKGERAKARARVDHVLEVLKHADPGLPMLARAKELRARLAR
jgi:hypothetical protein